MDTTMIITVADVCVGKEDPEGWEGEIEIEVEYSYQPYEPEVRYYSDGSGYPGCAEAAEVHSVTYNCYELLPTCYDMDEIEEEILDQLHEDY